MQNVSPLSASDTPGLQECLSDMTATIADHGIQKNFQLLFLDLNIPSHILKTSELHLDNELTAKIRRRLRLLLGEEDRLYQAKNGGYAVLHYPIFKTKERFFAERIVHAFSEPCELDGEIFYIDISIGIARYPFDAEDAQTLLDIAYESMKQIETEGKNLIGLPHIIHSGDTEIERTKIMKALPEAIERGDIRFVYQPQYSYARGRFVGAEMLARWEHDEYGVISPAVFIPLAEQSGMIGPLTVRALTEASAAFKYLEKYGHRDFSLSVNISPVFLTNGNFRETVSFLLERYDLKRYELHFEITEEFLLQNSKMLDETLQYLRDRHIRIELDDFGTGYTSLQHLVRLPIDIIKADRSFVAGIATDDKKLALLRAIVDLGRALNMEIVAEGIEYGTDDAVLRTFGDIVAQGYLYGKPVTLDELVEKISG